ncbi:hypothetical protein HRbin11_01015 [bacterium HR11]|nr:hypothetical protein HRbin11_01015 [bacterium HR11]
MPYDPEKHHRRSIRLKGYDYTQPGAYFVTIVTQNRVCLFGEVVDGTMRLNDAGRMVQAVWNDLPRYYPGVAIDAFVVMPNHIHGIIILVGAGPCACPNIGPRACPIAGQPRGVAPTVSLGQPQGVALAFSTEGEVWMGIPDLVDNRKYKLADVLRNVLAQSQGPRLDVVTAYFNLKGLEVLEPEIYRLIELRLLLGKEQEQRFVVGKRLLAELEDATARAEVTATEIQRWRDFLARDAVAIRRYVRTFLHGKAYIVHGVPALGAVGIVGSSNFTGGGLTTNRELNAVLKQSSAVRELQDWFEAHWAEAEDYKAELLALLENFTRVYTPYEIYIKVVYEALRDQLDQDLGERDAKPSPIALADFQHDGYLAAKEILENYGGVLIADSVGLGKTYLALRLLDDYAYRERQTALIVCPAAIKCKGYPDRPDGPRPWLVPSLLPAITSTSRIGPIILNVGHSHPGPGLHRDGVRRTWPRRSQYRRQNRRSAGVSRSCHQGTSADGKAAGSRASHRTAGHHRWKEAGGRGRRAVGWTQPTGMNHRPTRNTWASHGHAGPPQRRAT